MDLRTDFLDLEMGFVSLDKARGHRKGHTPQIKISRT